MLAVLASLGMHWLYNLCCAYDLHMYNYFRSQRNVHSSEIFVLNYSKVKKNQKYPEKFSQKRSGASQHVLTCQSRSKVLKYILETMIGDVWHFWNYCTSCQSKVCSKKSYWDKYKSEFLTVCQSCLFKLRHFAVQCLGNLHSKQHENEQFTSHITFYHFLYHWKLTCQTWPFSTLMFIFVRPMCKKTIAFRTKNRQVPAKYLKRPFLTVYTGWLDSADVKKFWTG